MAQFPFLDPDLSVAERVADVLSRLTLDEKVGQMVNRAPAIPRLGITEYDWWSECLHGVARAGKATVFPQAIGLAATWDEDLMHRVAAAISDEARAKHQAAAAQGNRTIYTGLTYWSPNINILRDPRWGRAQETFGEDPFLTARMGVAFVKGLQGDDPTYLKLVATPKHYAAHSGPERGRSSFDAKVCEKDLRETYLPAFEACVKEAGAISVMGAYNRLNGEPCNASNLLLDRILREEWGFEGYVVSDCGAIENIVEHHRTAETMAEAAAQSVKAGCDLCCGCAYEALVEAVEKGLLTEADVDRALGRLLTARIRLGMFDPLDRVPYASIPPSVVCSPSHKAAAREAAQKSIVLLKNNGVLPLSPRVKEVYVVGPTAASLDTLWGNYNGFSGEMTTFLEGVVGAVSPGTKVGYNPGCRLIGPAEDCSHLDWQLDFSEVIVACLGLSPSMEGEEGDASLADMGGDRLNLDLPESQKSLLRYLRTKNKPLVLVLTGGSAVTISEEVELADAVLFAWYPGCEGGKALADVLFGAANPSGRLPVTFPRSAGDLPPLDDYSMAGRTYRFSKVDPLFPFGYGLSYTSFAYSGLRLSSDRVPAGEGLTASVEVTNTGKTGGEEVVQVYVRDVEATVRVPNHRLAGFQRVGLRAGETKRVEIRVGPEAFDIVGDDGVRRREAGEFQVFVGGGQPGRGVKGVGCRV